MSFYDPNFPSYKWYLSLDSGKVERMHQRIIYLVPVEWEYIKVYWVIGGRWSILEELLFFDSHGLSACQRETPIDALFTNIFYLALPLSTVDIRIIRLPTALSPLFIGNILHG